MGMFDMITNPLKGISSFLSPDEPYKKAAEQSKKYYKEAQGFERPFMQHGEEAYGDISGILQKLMNPAALENEWAQSYEMSPYAKNLLEENKSQGLDAASAMGLLGSSGALNNIQTGAGKIVSADRQQFLDDLMQKYMQAIGLGTNIYGVGANAANTLAGAAQNQGQDMASLAFGQQAAPGKLFENLLRTGVGFAAAGPMGGALMNMQNPGSSGSLYNAGNRFNQ